MPLLRASELLLPFDLECSTAPLRDETDAGSAGRKGGKGKMAAFCRCFDVARAEYRSLTIDYTRAMHKENHREIERAALRISRNTRNCSSLAADHQHQ